MSSLCMHHAPATSETECFLNTDSLATMKPKAIIVNTARGRLINEQALAMALERGVIGGAALDVFQTEPIPEFAALRCSPNLIITAHAAWYFQAAVTKLQALVAENIERVLTGKSPRCLVPNSR